MHEERPNTSLDKLRLKQKQLAERIKQLEVTAKARQRKLDTRRKVLLGALLSTWMEEDAALSKRVAITLPSFLTRQVDRDVFALPPLDLTEAAVVKGQGNADA